MAGEFNVRMDINQFEYTLVALQKAYAPASLAPWAKTRATAIAKEAFEANFDTQGSRLGKKWAPLRASTQADRIRKGYRGAEPKLKRTGKLKDDVVNLKPKVRVDPELEVTWDGAFIDAQYFAPLHTGFRHWLSGGKIEGRPMFGFNEQDARKLTLSLYGWIGRQIQLGRL